MEEKETTITTSADAAEETKEKQEETNFKPSPALREILLALDNLGYENIDITLGEDGEYKFTRPEDLNYESAVYLTALNAIEHYRKCVADAGLTGYQAGFIKGIMCRLVYDKPIIPIDEDNACWTLVNEIKDTGLKLYQCARCGSVFKEVAADGSIWYNDVDRWACRNMVSGMTYTSSLITNILNRAHPVKLPYLPSIFMDDVLVYEINSTSDPMERDFSNCVDTVKLIDPISHESLYYKETDDGFTQIDEAEWNARFEVYHKGVLSRVKVGARFAIDCDYHDIASVESVKTVHGGSTEATIVTVKSEKDGSINDVLIDDFMNTFHWSYIYTADSITDTTK